ncbi:MAG: type II toxin-antitoxin system RelE/ParE family toxin [Deltaproteobacteria bacterium]|jgi:toxin ParE1/3/4|nr:type II toxin-antitoxin system RelE/ParE family toxin [Deltaproteobacteria bacterium]
MKLKWSETASRDLLSIRRYMAEDNPTAAHNWIARLRTRARNAVHAPLAGRKVPEFSRDDVREVIEGNYRIVYQVHNDHISVLTVFEAHRLIPAKNAI